MKQFVVILLSIYISTPVLGFGQTGHRVTGLLAERYLSDQAKQAIKEILVNETLAEVSTFADEQRANPSEFWQKTANPWHYMTVPDGQTYTDDMAPEEGDAITALWMFTQQLKSSESTAEEKALAIKFIVHLIGDMHQPLHVGNGTDRGGNDVKVQFWREMTNLHRVWDTHMIESQNLSYTEWTQFLGAKITAQDVKNWSSIEPLDWAKESQAIRMTMYPKTDKLGSAYLYQHLPTVKLRLKQASVRLALYLNHVFQ